MTAERCRSTKRPRLYLLVIDEFAARPPRRRRHPRVGGPQADSASRLRSARFAYFEHSYLPERHGGLVALVDRGESIGSGASVADVRVVRCQPKGGPKILAKTQLR